MVLSRIPVKSRTRVAYHTCTYRTVYITVSHPPAAVFQARLLGNQECAKTERPVFGKLSGRCLQRRPLWYRMMPTLFQLPWRYRPWNIDPGGCDINSVICQVYGTDSKLIPKPYRTEHTSNTVSVCYTETGRKKMGSVPVLHR